MLLKLIPQSFFILLDAHLEQRHQFWCLLVERPAQISLSLDTDEHSARHLKLPDFLSNLLYPVFIINLDPVYDANMKLRPTTKHNEGWSTNFS